MALERPGAGGVPLISVSDLRKSFGPTRAVDGISFAIERGEILGFLGPNGAGKSTTLKVITGYLAADSGRARVAGIDVAEDPLEARRKIGYLPETLPLYWEMRVDEYLEFIAASRSIPRHLRRERIDAVVEMLSLTRMRKRPTGSLSKGYRQRVGLAQALLHDPEILILDEPTNGLDPQQIVEIRELIRGLARSKAVLFSTHILQEIAAICSRIMIIRDGRLIAAGTTTELARQAGTADWELVVAGELSGDQISELELGAPLSEAVEADGRVYRFRCEQTLDLARLATRVSAHGARLIEVRRPHRSLEEVYMQLTGSGRKGAA